MQSTPLIPLLLQMIGLVIIIAEVIIPSGGILSIFAAGLIGYSIYYVFHHLSPVIGYFVIGADVLLLPLMIIIGFKILAKSPVTLHTSLSQKEGVTSQPADLSALVGGEGLTLTKLRPSGSARIQGRRVDVVSRGSFIEKDEPITVLNVTGNQVIVDQLNPQRKGDNS